MDFSAYDVALVPMITITVELVKQVFPIPKRFIPLVTILLGQFAAFIYIAPGDPKHAILAGLVMAFSSMGLWSGAKNTIGR